MSIFFQLPMDLRERWWAAITLDEREAVEAEFKASEKKEKLTIGQMIADFVENVGSRKEGDFVIFVQDCYTPEERSEVMEGLMGCKCCSRHQEHKCRHESAEIEKSCMCSCRHYARLFKRKNLA
jgi:hypothetical protein